MSTLNEEFQVHETLNPKLFDSAGRLFPDVRAKLIEIVGAFEEYISVPVDIVDVQLVGSNASYNYTESSDLDLHIIANYELVSKDINLLQALYDAKKSNFNKNLDVSIHGIKVEMYVQDIKSNVVSNGIYSVCDNRWIKEPKPIKSITKHNTEKEFQKWEARINAVIASGSYEQISNTLNTLYLVRHNSIATDGEYAKGNQLFKDIRSAGLLDKLKTALDGALEKRLTLESYLSNLYKVC